MNDVQREVAASVSARRELGDEYDDVLAAGLVERIQAEIDRRVDERVAQRLAEQPATPPAPRPGVGVGEVLLAGGSFATAFLVTVYALNNDAAVVAVMVWFVVLWVNLAPWLFRHRGSR